MSPFFEQCPRCERLFATSRQLDYHLETECEEASRPTEPVIADTIPDSAGY